MVSAEPSVLVVGPGQTFGAELCREIFVRRHDVATISRRPLDGHAFEYVEAQYQADVTNTPSFRLMLEVVCDDFPRLSGVVYNAVSDRPRNVNSCADDILESMEVSMGALTAFQALHKLLAANNGQFVLTGGEYARLPDPQQLGLSMQQVAVHGLTAALQRGYDSPRVIEYPIVGRAANKKQQVAEDLAQLACGLDIKW